MDKKTEGQRLKEVILELGYTIKDFAKKSEISRSTLNSWFTQEKLSISIIKKIKRALSDMGENPQIIDKLFSPGNMDIAQLDTILKALADQLRQANERIAELENELSELKSKKNP